ncbi:UNVERIFIED_ORG: putative SOS response-associated peptidase YedK [Shinella zoogloeoides]|nr:putative SOS response-associated peptidase YedK [Shinella zoogloeoides]
MLAKTDLAREFFSLAEIDDLTERYNIAPTQPIVIVVASERQERRAATCRSARPCWCAGASCPAG